MLRPVSNDSEEGMELTHNRHRREGIPKDL